MCDFRLVYRVVLQRLTLRKNFFPYSKNTGERKRPRFFLTPFSLASYHDHTAGKTYCSTRVIISCPSSLFPNLGRKHFSHGLLPRSLLLAEMARMHLLAHQHHQFMLTLPLLPVLLALTRVIDRWDEPNTVFPKPSLFLWNPSMSLALFAAVQSQFRI